MLNDKNAGATVAVKSIGEAKSFYEDVLGLEPVKDMGQGVVYRSGGSELLVYESEYAGTNKATAVTWNVGGEIAGLVGALKAKGAAFEHYPDLEGMTVEDDLHVGHGMKLAWLKDPDGNILALAGT